MYVCMQSTVWCYAKNSVLSTPDVTEHHMRSEKYGKFRSDEEAVVVYFNISYKSSSGRTEENLH
jgi:hypothetical protein